VPDAGSQCYIAIVLVGECLSQFREKLMSEIIDQLKGFLEEELDIEAGDLELDTPLFSGGIIDSFSLVSLLKFVETTFELRVGPTDVNLENFDSLGRMVTYIERCRGS